MREQQKMMGCFPWLCLSSLLLTVAIFEFPLVNARGGGSGVAESSKGTILPPLPILPLPSARQLAWQRREKILFLHFGMNTFTDSEWGTGKVHPSTFRPDALDASQWLRVAKDSGFDLVILTAKHHDGFCLWPSLYTDYSVASSPWRGGHGDVVRELVNAAASAHSSSSLSHDFSVGLYLSPWDRHDSRYGKTKAYNEYYLAQLHELLTEYGSIAEIWFDGAKGSNAPKMDYMFQRWFSFVYELQSATNIFSDAGPDVRWVGDETGSAGTTCWSMMNKTNAKIGLGSDTKLLNSGDPFGQDWVPAECDVSIRPGWFWHANEHPKNLSQLLNLYYESVGRNCVLLLNVPPNSTGLIAEEDARVLVQFHVSLQSIFGHNLGSHAKAFASSVRGPPFAAENVLNDDMSTYWSPAERGGDDSSMFNRKVTLKLFLEKATDFNVVMIQEAIGWGQRVAKYRVQWRAFDDHKWHPFSNGTTIGYKKLDKLFCSSSSSSSSCLIKGAIEVKLVIVEARAAPLIATFGLYLDDISQSF